uniref:Uncharacterized protein n=1 Tax=Arundo donax TaxID=35708 RepID=A0A0A9GMR4_ARUDO
MPREQQQAMPLTPLPNSLRASLQPPRAPPPEHCAPPCVRAASRCKLAAVRPSAATSAHARAAAATRCRRGRGEERG